MRLESNTIGNVDDPTEDDIHRSFHDDWEDVAGNVYTLYLDDGTSISSISGHALRNFSLSLGDGSRTVRVCTTPLTRDEVRAFFIRRFQGDQSWISELQWKTERASWCRVTR